MGVDVCEGFGAWAGGQSREKVGRGLSMLSSLCSAQSDE